MNIQDFYLIQSGNNGTTYDTLYTLDGASGQINKFSLQGGRLDGPRELHADRRRPGAGSGA